MMPTNKSDRKPKGSPTLSHRIEYAVLRFAEAAVNAVPRRAALALGSAIGRTLCLLGVYRKVVLKNFEHVGIWDDAQLKKILPKLYMNIGRYAIDVLRKGSLPPYRMVNGHIYKRILESGKGTVIVLAHFGNWELLAAIYGGETAGRLHVIAMPMRNPLVEEWLLKKRTALCAKTIYTKNALRGSLAALRKNGIVGILIDQHIRNMGTPAPFLGKTADTVRTAAGLAVKTGADAVPMYALLCDDGSYEIVFAETEPPTPADGADEESVITALQKQHNDIMSDWIRQYPEHWFGWFHRRFKGYVVY